MKIFFYSTHKIFIYKHIGRVFFFIFFLFFSNEVFPQVKINPVDTLISGDFITDSIKSDYFFDLGKKFSEEENLESAINSFLKCLTIRKHIFNPNHKDIAFASNRTGVTFKNLGRLNEAIECFQEVIKINTINYGGTTYRNGTPYTNIGNVYQQKGNFEDAIKYQKQAITHYQTGLSQYPELQNNIIKSKYNLAYNLYFTQQFNEALEIIFGCYKTAPYFDKASFLGLLGNIYISLKNNLKAKENFNLSVKELRDNASNAQDSISLADLHIVFSQFLISINDFTDAENNLKAAYILIKDTVHGRDIMNLYFTYGELYSKKPFGSNSLENFKKSKLDNLNVALLYYQKAIIAVSNNFTNITTSANPSVEQCSFQARTLQILLRKAETYYELAQLNHDNVLQKQANLENSLSASKLASDLLNNLRTGTVSEESKIVMTQLQNSAYLFSVKVASELFDLTNKKEYFEIALQNAERNKAASLLDNLSDVSARQGSLLPDSLVKKEENINDQISFINQKLFEENQSVKPDSSKIKRLGEQRFQLDYEKNNLVHYLEVNFRDYYQLKYTDDKVSIGVMQKKLSKDELILEYISDKSPNLNNTHNLYLFLVSKNDFELKKLNVDSSYINDIDEVYKFLSASDFINIPFEKYNGYLKSAYNLYKLLIRPVEEKLINHSVTIIPDGKLSYIPFDALLYNLPEKTEKLDFKNLDYLIKKFSFNYSYSAGLYLNKFNTEKRASKKLMAFAPIYGEYKNSGDNEYNQLAPLTGIVDEVKAISKYIKSRLFIGEDATESNFRKNYKDYDILHLAMHAILNDSLPMFSKLAFSPEKDSLHTEDGWLTTSELYNLKLNSRLSVLSACNTGSGKLMEGEGVMSLARGFFYAGCPSVVMTLWEVEDRSGAEIMSEFYRLLNAGKKKHDALRLAKLKHIEESNPVTAHPHVWLCYVTIGNTDALYSSNDYYFFAAILFILIGVVIDQLYKNKKAR